MRVKKIVAPVLLAIVSAALLVQLPVAIADRSFSYDFLDPVIDVKDILVKHFVDQSRLDEDKMRRAIIDGMIGTLDDPHTVYIPQAEIGEFNKDLRGTYVGIGCEVGIVDDYLTINSPMDGSPALEAGIMAGDVVLEIEGQSTFKMPVTECISKLMGPEGTKVSIKVRHLDGVEQDYQITRRKITTRTVRGLRREGSAWNYCIHDKLGLSYVRITQFNESTIGELRAALDQLQAPGLNGLVLDLRDNPGGSLETAVKMADLFLNEGLIVSVRPRAREEHSFPAQRAGTLPEFPMIVLVNGQSASASEIVAGALQENGRAKVLGTRSFGKGSVQEVRDLEFDRGTLKFTTAHYHLKSGRNINRASDSVVWGVDPDAGMVVPIADEEAVEMYRAKREFEVLRTHANGDVNSAGGCADAQWIRTKMKDEQLARAVEALSVRVSNGDWPTVGEDRPELAAFDLEMSRAVKRRSDLMDALQSLDQRIEELQKLQAKVGKPPLLPPEVDLVNGNIAVRDKHGNLVGAFRIEAGDVERALSMLRVTPVNE